MGKTRCSSVFQGWSVAVQNEYYTSLMWKHDAEHLCWLSKLSVNDYIHMFERWISVFTCFFVKFITSPTSSSSTILPLPSAAAGSTPSLLSRYVCFPHWPLVSLLYLSCLNTRVKNCPTSIRVVRYQLLHSLINICA